MCREIPSGGDSCDASSDYYDIFRCLRHICYSSDEARYGV
jgi:hypothetical protein